MNEQNSYYAFISYNSADEKWAKWLQHNLEYYHIPSALCKEYPELPKKIRPVFWYKQDLSGTKLKKALNNELSSSKYLIVICSPDSAKADWVNDEVVAFIEQGKGDRIIPFIVAGTPHAKNPDEECFPPALRNLTRDEEIRGVDVRRKEGKYHALVDVIATMFGVRFDVLWQRHERRRKRIRNIWITVASVFLLCALGIYDYNRTKIEYYADFVDRWGVAEGIIPLDDDQVSHRHHSYKFEYTRVPFGEKDFYSWRLKRVSLVNSKGVISDYVPDHHAFFYPIQEFEYTDGYVTDIINRDTYKRVVMRYSVKDDYEHNTACLIDMEGKEKRQGSAYLDASTTSMMHDVNSNSTKSKIKRFHYTRNEDGYITKITYHANDGDDLTGTAIGDNNNIYGKLFELDSLGRIATLTYINNEGRLMTDKFGVGSIKYTYDSLGETASTIYLDNNEHLTNNEQRFAIISAKFDKYGNIIEQWNEGSDGKLCFDYKNRHRRVIKYDSMGCIIEDKYYDINGNLCYCSDNYAIQRAEYDLKGRPIKVMYYDIDDKPCYIKNNFSEFRAKYNSNDCVIEYSFYGINNLPCMETEYGVHKMRFNVNEYNYVVEQAFYDTDNKAIISPFYGFHRQVNEFDDYHRLVAIKYLDCNSKPSINTQDYTSKCVYSYDHRGNMSKIEHFDSENNPSVCKNGYARVVYGYDNYGNLASESYYGIDNNPIYIDMYASVKCDYYPNSKLKECRYYDEDGKLCLNNYWYSISRFKYDNNGNQIEVSYFDTDTLPTYYKDGLYHSLRSEYDSNGDCVLESYYDINNNITRNSKYLYAIGKYKYDQFHRVTESAYYDENKIPCFYDKEYHILRTQYDNKGNILKYSIYDTKGLLTISREGTAVIQKEYDEKNNCIRTDYKDAKGRNVNQENSWYSTELVKYNLLGQVARKEYLNKDGIPCLFNSFIAERSLLYSSVEYDYDDKGHCINIRYFDENGQFASTMSYAQKLISYDEMGRIIEEKYKQHNGLLAEGGNHHMAILRYNYSRSNNYVNEILFYDADSILQANLHQIVEKGVITKKKIQDSDGKLKSMHIYGYTDTRYAMMTDSLDVYGRNIKRVYYGENGLPGNIDEGFAVLLNTFDNAGRLIKQELFDENGNATNGIFCKFHRRIIEYNNRGLVTEEAYYDKSGLYVNTPFLQGYCKQTCCYDERGIISSAVAYISVDGKAIDENELLKSKEQEQEKKVNGTLILANVELPGLFINQGYEGLYCIMEWNEWCMYDDIVKFSEVFSSSLPNEKHILMVPCLNNGLGKPIDVTFPAGSLGVRIMDGSSNRLFNELVDVYEDYKKYR